MGIPGQMDGSRVVCRVYVCESTVGLRLWRVKAGCSLSGRGCWPEYVDMLKSAFLFTACQLWGVDNLYK